MCGEVLGWWSRVSSFVVLEVYMALSSGARGTRHTAYNVGTLEAVTHMSICLDPFFALHGKNSGRTNTNTARCV